MIADHIPGVLEVANGLGLSRHQITFGHTVQSVREKNLDAVELRHKYKFKGYSLEAGYNVLVVSRNAVGWSSEAKIVIHVEESIGGEESDYLLQRDCSENSVIRWREHGQICQPGRAGYSIKTRMP